MPQEEHNPVMILEWMRARKVGYMSVIAGKTPVEEEWVDHQEQLGVQSKGKSWNERVTQVCYTAHKLLQSMYELFKF